MSQLDLDGAVEAQTVAAQNGTEASTGLLAEAPQRAPAPAFRPPSAVRSTAHGVTHTSSLLINPAVEASADDVAGKETRRVGARYLAQQLLTCAPLVIVDLLLLMAVIVLARQTLLFVGLKIGLNLSACFLPIASGFLLIAAELGLYPGIRLSPVEEFRRLAMAVTSIFAVWVVGMLMMSDGISLQRFVFLALAYGLYLVLLPICRGTLRRFICNRSWWGFPTFVCGNDMTAVRVHDWLANNRRLGLRPMGVIAEPADVGALGDEPWYAGTWAQTRELAEKKGVYWAVVVPPDGGPAALGTAIAEHLTALPHIHILSDLIDVSEGWAKHQQFEGLAGVQIQQNLMLPLPRLTKRCMDVVASVIGGIMLLPLLFYIAVAVKMSSRGPILYGHDRIGKNGKHFKAWKFRSMFQDSSFVLEKYLEENPDYRAEWERDHKLKFDPRVTRIGRFIRKTSLDELPQIWNVLRGEMSLVGPRPIVTAEIVKYGPYYGLYTMVTPGITGLWQISGRNNTTYDERVQLDAYYVRNWSPWLDMYLLIRTIRIVLFADGAY